MRNYQVVGRAAPTEKTPLPKIYRMRIFAKNEVLAKSKFWFYMKKINKVKKSRGEVLEVNEFREPKQPRTVKNFGVWLRYDSRTGTHNMYKEFRDVSYNGAVRQLHSEMAGNHRALSSCIQIIRIATLEDSMCKRSRITQMHKPKLRFPIVRKLPLVPKRFRTTYKAVRPTTFVL